MRTMRQMRLKILEDREKKGRSEVGLNPKTGRCWWGVGCPWGQAPVLYIPFRLSLSSSFSCYLLEQWAQCVRRLVWETFLRSWPLRWDLKGEVDLAVLRGEEGSFRQGAQFRACVGSWRLTLIQTSLVSRNWQLRLIVKVSAKLSFKTSSYKVTKAFQLHPHFL